MRGFITPICAAFALSIASTADAQLALAPSKPARVCDQVDVILSVADFLLIEPQNRPRFWRDVYGADAAYFRIRYDGLRYEEGRALLDQLAARTPAPERLVSLRVAFARPADRSALFAAIEPTAAKSPFASLDQSALRAMVVDGDIDRLVDGFSQWRRANEESFDRSAASANLANAIDDLDDGVKAMLADRMEKAGLWATASEISARRSDLADWLALQDRKPGGPIAAKDRDLALRRPFVIARAYPIDLDKQPAELQRIERARTWRGISEALYALTRRAPNDGALLSTVLNQHGDPRIATDLAAGLVADIDAGRLDPINAPDDVVRAMVERLDRIIGRVEREKQLRSFKIYTLWAQQDEASAAIDRALARQALAPVVRGEKPEAERPSALTEDFPWNAWKRMANIVRVGSDASVTDDRMIAAELLDAAGRWSEALNVLKAERDWQAARRRAHALMVSLDRRCGRDLSHPVPFSEPIYRFSAR